MGLKSFLNHQYTQASQGNAANILATIPPTKIQCENILDLGCDDGVWTIKLAKAASAKNIFGVEIVEERRKLALAQGVQAVNSDLNQPLPFKDDFFDLVHANQVIEHLSDVDNLTLEIFRVLKPGGRVIISTENASSWHNIFAHIMGWQQFSLTNFSRLQSGIGNPLALHSGERPVFASWTHKVIFNYQGLKDYFSVLGFHDVVIRGSGYYPLPYWVGGWDVRHSHFLTLSAIKPKR